MKNKTLLWIIGILAAVLLAGSFVVKYTFDAPNIADIIRVIGFICLAVFTVYKFRGEKPEE